MTQHVSPQSVLSKFIANKEPHCVLMAVRGRAQYIAAFRAKCFRDYPPERHGGNQPAYTDVFDFNGIVPRHESVADLFTATERRLHFREVREYMMWVVGATKTFDRKTRSYNSSFRDAFYKEAPTTTRNAALLWASVFHPDLVAQARAEHRFETATGDSNWMNHHQRMWGTPLNAQHTQWVSDQPTSLVFYFSVQPKAFEHSVLGVTHIERLLSTMAQQHPDLKFVLFEHNVKGGLKAFNLRADIGLCKMSSIALNHIKTMIE